MRKNGASWSARAERGVDRGDAVVDLLLGLGERHLVEGERMVLAVGADGVAGGVDPAHHVGIGRAMRPTRK